MAFPKKLLNQNEEIVLDLRPHWWSILPASAGLAVTVLFGIVALIKDWHTGIKGLAGVLVLVALGYFVVRYVRWASENFVVTNERVIYRTGVIAKKGIEIPLDRINTVFFNQSLPERLIGAGDLAIESAGEQGRQSFTEVRRPAAVQQEIYRQMERNQQRTFEQQAQATAAAFRESTGGVPGGQAGPTIPQQIQQLDELRRQGLITDADFEAKKQDLLGRM